jgi:hypothetical protein
MDSFIVTWLYFGNIPFYNIKRQLFTESMIFMTQIHFAIRITNFKSILRYRQTGTMTGLKMVCVLGHGMEHIRMLLH